MKKHLNADDYRRRAKPARILIHCLLFTEWKAQSGLVGHWPTQSRTYMPFPLLSRYLLTRPKSHDWGLRGVGWLETAYSITFRRKKLIRVASVDLQALQAIESLCSWSLCVGSTRKEATKWHEDARTAGFASAFDRVARDTVLHCSLWLHVRSHSCKAVDIIIYC